MMSGDRRLVALELPSSMRKLTLALALLHAAATASVPRAAFVRTLHKKWKRYRQAPDILEFHGAVCEVRARARARAARISLSSRARVTIDSATPMPPLSPRSRPRPLARARAPAQHCDDMVPIMDQLKKDMPRLKIQRFEVWYDPEAYELLQALDKDLPFEDFDEDTYADQPSEDSMDDWNARADSEVRAKLAGKSMFGRKKKAGRTRCGGLPFYWNRKTRKAMCGKSRCEYADPVTEQPRARARRGSTVCQPAQVREF